MTTSRYSERQARILRAAEQRAFDGYMRWGRTPDAGRYSKTAARNLSRKALGEARPTAYYTWRTAHDERVRSTHAAREGQVFAWNEPPATGHPGHERNCRCWAEPYYGTPFVSDTTLALSRQQRTDTTGQEPWQLIETLTRPDGSLAESRFLMREGTRIVSTFNGGLVVNEVTLPDGRLVKVHRQDGIQSIFVGDGLKPVVQSVWTASGPRIAVPRTRVAFDGSPLDLMPRLVTPDDPFTPHRFGDIEIIDPMRPGGVDPGGAGAAIAMALLALYLASQATPASVGAGAKDKPVLTVRIWSQEGKLTPVPVSVTSLTAEQVAQNCKRLPEVQKWTDEAALALAHVRVSTTAQNYGMQLHLLVKKRILALKELLPEIYADTFAEQSYTGEGLETAYGALGSSRLDVVERRQEVACIYDVKTGVSGITADQLRRATAIAVKLGTLTFYIIEVRPSGAL